MYKAAIISGISLAALAVVLGAFGAHGLKNLAEPAQIGIYEKGVTYQFYHSAALILVGILHSQYPQRSLRLAAPLFGLGIFLFSGSLYLMVALSIGGGSIGAAGIITPIGGLCFIGGWIAALIGVIKHK